MNATHDARILVLGCGNPGRQDDGLGPALIDALAALGLPGVDMEVNYQLNIEDGATVAGYGSVVFVDASRVAPEPFEWKRIQPSAEIAFTTHSVSAESVLAVCEAYFGAAPEAWLLGIRGYGFELAEGLSPRAGRNLKQALDYMQGWLRREREKAMDTRKKTVLTVDDDPDIRAALRIVLEAAGFAVGEAGSAAEGIKAFERTQPDAVIIDLMMETVDAGSVMARKLKDGGYKGPVYMLSSAGDTIQFNIDAQELGLSGIFQKPVDPNVLTNTLRTELQSR